MEEKIDRFNPSRHTPVIDLEFQQPFASLYDIVNEREKSVS